VARIALRNLTKRFGKVVAVNNLNLEIADKSFVVLVGPSGCGKTTILRIIAGLEDQDEGETYIGDKEVSQLEPKDRDIAMVFQSYALYPHMTAFDNMAFGLRAKGVPKKEIQERVTEAAKLLGIEHLLNRKPRQLSGGEMQRVALGRAITRSPKAFLFDEPLSNLDAKLRTRMRGELKELQRQLKTTTIYVTHDQVEAMTLADKMAVLNNGILQQYDSPGEVFESPSNTFVAGFIGTPPMNFIKCSLADNTLDAGEFVVTLSEDLASIIREKGKDSELTIGVRPQDITMAKSAADIAAPFNISATVVFAEPLGTSTILHLNVGSIPLVMETREFVTYDQLRGAKLDLQFEMDKIHVFDKNGDTIL